MLTPRERLIAAASAAVLCTGLLGTAYAANQLSRLDAGASAEPPTGAAPRMSHPGPPPSLPGSATPARAATLPPIAAAATPPRTGCPPPSRPGQPPTAPKPPSAPTVPDAALPATLPAGPKATHLTAVSGKGIWVTNWQHDAVDVHALVTRASQAGLTSVWVRTGGSLQGYYGTSLLSRLVPAAHAAGLRVVAWDFPTLSDPVADAARAHRALTAGIDAFAPDIETPAEGTHDTPRRVALYLSLVRSYAGNRPIAATVPRPTEHNLATFPYAAFQPYADVFVPMVYWSCHEPGQLVAQSLHRLGRWLPVAPVGQAYDMARDGGRVGLPSRAETWRFLDAARRGGAVGASLWTMETIGPGQWAALAAYPWQPR